MKKLKTFVFLLGAVSLLFFLQACATATQADSHPPKYVFLMIGDGMGQNPVKLARIHAIEHGCHAGQRRTPDQ